MTQLDTVLQWRGQTLYDQDGDKIGKIEEIYLDQQTDEPEWALVNTGLFGSKSTFVPIANANPSDDGVRVPFQKDQVKDAPGIDPDGELTQDQESELYRHYGMEYGEAQSDSGLPEGQRGDVTTAGTGTTGVVDTDREASYDRDSDVRDPDAVGHDVSGPTTDEAMTRSEEELHVGTTEREAGRARLRKYVVTENVTETVPVQREEVRLEREPITDANVGDATSGPDISDEEHEVVLHEEEVVVEKRTVPVERVRLGKETVTDERQVDEEVRKEEIEVEGAGERGIDSDVDRRDVDSDPDRRGV